MNDWGLGRLAQVLRTRVKLSEKCCEQGSTIVAQVISETLCYVYDRSHNTIVL